jgi:hypothetical protein
MLRMEYSGGRARKAAGIEPRAAAAAQPLNPMPATGTVLADTPARPGRGDHLCRALLNFVGAASFRAFFMQTRLMQRQGHILFNPCSLQNVIIHIDTPVDRAYSWVAFETVRVSKAGSPDMTTAFSV